MARYQITKTDIPFAREFLAQPIGYHSPGLQRVLNRMRGADWEFKYILVVEERYAKWRLGRLAKKRGSKVEMVQDVTYTNLFEAERDIFKRRWKDLTGQDVETLLSQSS